MSLNLKVNNIHCSYGAHQVLRGVTFDVLPGAFLGIIGPNGSGKSTLVKTLVATLKPRLGTVVLGGEDIFNLRPRMLARQVAVVPQSTSMEFNFNVQDVVLMGRNPYLGRFQSESGKDLQIARWAMEQTGTWQLRDRPISQLSGGESQRVILSRALAQEPKILILDEPTAHLDIAYQVELLGLLRRLNRESGLTVIAVLHDLNLAAQYADYLLLLHRGEIYSAGLPDTVITQKNILEVYNTSVLVEKHVITGKPQVTLLTGSERRIRTGGCDAHIHIICGGGSGQSLMEELQLAGYRVTTGVLNAGDSDWYRARALGIEVIEEAPFCPVSDKAHRMNMECISQAKALVLAAVSIGFGNMRNLEAALEGMKQGKPLYLVDSESITTRDYAGGQAQTLVREMIDRGAILLGQEEVTARMVRCG
ncbi:MAG: ABC transporter ATP-binding protein [Bacillota bacterium]